MGKKSKANEKGAVPAEEAASTAHVEKHVREESNEPAEKPKKEKKSKHSDSEHVSDTKGHKAKETPAAPAPSLSAEDISVCKIGFVSHAGAFGGT